MTHSGGKPHTNVGDKGQRYAVACQDFKKHDDEEPTVIGWTDTLTGCKALVKMIDAHPVWHSPRVIDRETGQVIDLATL